MCRRTAQKVLLSRSDQSCSSSSCPILIIQSCFEGGERKTAISPCSQHQAQDVSAKHCVTPCKKFYGGLHCLTGVGIPAASQLAARLQEHTGTEGSIGLDPVFQIWSNLWNLDLTGDQDEYYIMTKVACQHARLTLSMKGLPSHVISAVV